jgi:hypothetical protein
MITLYAEYKTPRRQSAILARFRLLPWIAEKHLVDLDQRIAQLSELRDDLTRAVTRWKDGGVPERCASTLCGMISEAAEPGSGPLMAATRSPFAAYPCTAKGRFADRRL